MNISEYFNDIQPALNQEQAPKETPVERPDLRCALVCFVHNNQPLGVTDGVYLVKPSGSVLVRGITNCPILIVDGSDKVGFWYPGQCPGPKYTGPIDDEMMANILIYG